MKSYINIEQSKILAKILPIESADMCWCNNSIKGVNYTDEFSANLYTVKEMKELFDTTLNGWDKYWELIPCWSLASLLNYLREVDYFPEINVDEFEVTMSINYYNEDEAKPLAPVHNIKVKAESFIDACYELILKLKEQKLL